MPPEDALPSCELGSADVSVTTVVVDSSAPSQRHGPDRHGPADDGCRDEREETTDGERRHASVIALPP